MRWDFFRYLLDIQGLAVTTSKDEGREISGHKDKDKSQPQLLSARSLNHRQVVVNISNNGHPTNVCEGDKKLSLSTAPQTLRPSPNKCLPSSSTSSLKPAPNPCTIPPTFIEAQNNGLVDDSIHLGDGPNKDSPLALSSSSSWKFRRTTADPDSQSGSVVHSSNNESPQMKIVAVSINLPRVDGFDERTRKRSEYTNFSNGAPVKNNFPPSAITSRLSASPINNSGLSPKPDGCFRRSNGRSHRDPNLEEWGSHSPSSTHYQHQPHSHISLSSSTDANFAEANKAAVDGKRDDEPATEDEASSIASSDDNASPVSSTTSISNSAENDGDEQPPALFSTSPAVSTSYSTLRWTRAVANQESLPQAQHNILRPISTDRLASPGKCGNLEKVDVSLSGGNALEFPIIPTTSTVTTIKIGESGNEPIFLQPRPTSIIGSCANIGPLFATTASSASVILPRNNVEIQSSSRSSLVGANNLIFAFQDKWRVLFDKYDREGFGEITWPDFLLALRSKEFQAVIEAGKLQLLEDLARVHSAQTNAITFQLFVNIMTGKRSRSFKCAVHHRDREVCSESDFHLLPLGYQSPTGVKRMARLIADEFLTDERDRKYYADHYRCLPPPLFIISITLIELGFFTYYTVWHGEISSSGPLPMDSPFVYRPDKRQEIWRFLFYMVLHAGWVHLMFNLLVQLLVGLPLEMVHGSLRIGCVYMAGVLAGSLGTSVFDPDVYLVGASGGVYALLAAHLANVLLNYNNMEFGLVRLLGVFLIASVDVGFAIYDRYAASPPLTEGSVPPVSYVAHLTGALAGLTIGLLVLKNFEQKLREQLMWWCALGVYAACTLFAILFNIFHPVYPEMLPSDFVEIPEKFPHHQMQQQQ